MAVIARDDITIVRVDDGETGEKGVSVKSVRDEWYLSTSDTSLADGSWSATKPKWTSGHYYWKRTYNVFSDGTTTFAPSENGYYDEAETNTASNVDSALKTAQNAENSAAAANDAADAAQADATTALNDIAEVNSDIATINSGISDMRTSISNAEAQIEQNTSDISTLTTNSASYATKDELSETHVTITQETQMAIDSLSNTISETYASKNEFSTLEGTLTTKIEQNQTDISLSATRIEALESDTEEQSKKITAAQSAADAAQDAVDQANADLAVLTSTVAEQDTKITQNADGITSLANRTTTVENKFTGYYTKTEADSKISQTATDITSTVSTTYETKDDASSKLTTAKSYADDGDSTTLSSAKSYADDGDASTLSSAKSYTTSQIKQSATDITSTVSTTYETKGDASSKLSTAESKINQLAESISLSVTGKLGGTASIVLSVDGSDQEKSLDLSGVRDEFAAEDSSITIEAGVVSFNTGTFLLNGDNVSIGSDGTLTFASGKGTLASSKDGKGIAFNGTGRLTGDMHDQIWLRTLDSSGNRLSQVSLGIQDNDSGVISTAELYSFSGGVHMAGVDTEAHSTYNIASLKVFPIDCSSGSDNNLASTVVCRSYSTYSEILAGADDPSSTYESFPSWLHIKTFADGSDMNYSGLFSKYSSSLGPDAAMLTFVTEGSKKHGVSMLNYKQGTSTLASNCEVWTDSDGVNRGTLTARDSSGTSVAQVTVSSNGIASLKANKTYVESRGTAYITAPRVQIGIPGHNLMYCDSSNGNTMYLYNGKAYGKPVLSYSSSDSEYGHAIGLRWDGSKSVLEVQVDSTTVGKVTLQK